MHSIGVGKLEKHQNTIKIILDERIEGFYGVVHLLTYLP